MTRRATRRSTFAALVLTRAWTSAFAIGCASLGGPVGPAARSARLRFYEVASTAQPGFHLTKDETGESLLVAEQPLLTERDVQEAGALLGERRNLVWLAFTASGATRLQEYSGGSGLVRLAIFLDDQVLMTPWLPQRVDDGRLVLDGGFTRGRAEELVASLNALRTQPAAERKP